MIRKSLLKLTCPIFSQKYFFKQILSARFNSNNTKSTKRNEKTKRQEKSKQQESTYEKNKNKDFSSLAILTVSVSTFCLSVWQIKRAYDKQKLIELLKNRTISETSEFPSQIQDHEKFIRENEYKPFKVKGYFLNESEIILTPRLDLTFTNKLPGGYVITPFALSKDPTRIILINRGYVPYTLFSQNSRRESLDENEVELTGILRSNEPESTYTPINKPPIEWHYRNVKEMSEWLKTEPIFLDEVKIGFKSNSPIGNQTEVDIKNNHFYFSITWFAISAAFTFLYIKRSIKTLF